MGPGRPDARASLVLAELPSDEFLLQSQVRWLDIERLGFAGDGVKGTDFGSLFAALHSLGHRIVVFVGGNAHCVAVGLGVVVPEDSAGRLNASDSIEAIDRLVKSRFPGSLTRRRYWDGIESELSRFRRYRHAGAIVGQPDVSNREERATRSPIGDVLQALPEKDLAILVIADPLGDPELSEEIERTSVLLQAAVGAASVETQETTQHTHSSRRAEGRGRDTVESSQNSRSQQSTAAKTTTTTLSTGATASSDASYLFGRASLSAGLSTERSWARSESESLGRALMRARSERHFHDSTTELATSRTVQTTVRSECRDVQATLAIELLEVERRRLLLGLSGGAWNVALHLGAVDATTLHSAGAILMGSLSGAQSLQRPLRFKCLQDDQAARALSQLAHLSPWKGEGEGNSAFRTLMNNDELGQVGALPITSVPGFEVRRAIEFGQSIPRLTEADGPPVDLGSLCVSGRSLDQRRVDVGLNSLTMHTLVAGATGSGKSTTVVHLLDSVWNEHRIPFLVVDPKEEYAELLAGCVDDLRVIRPTDLGLRINPFRVVGGRSVALHAEHLRDLFCASFDTEAAIPELILQAILEIYRRRGWNLRANTFTGHGSPTYPTLTDLQNEIPRTVARNGFAATLESNYRAAIGSRIRSLRSGWKADLLDGAESAATEVMFEHPTVLDVGQMDAAGRAFLMGLLILRLNALRRSSRNRDGRLRHLLVLEEAHHLLRSPSSMGTGGNGSRGHALETMANAIAELRAFGQGIVIADQSPQELHPSVLRGTNLKIIHRLLEGHDQEVIAESLGLDDTQRRALGLLDRGKAIVRAAAWESAVMVAVKRAAAG